MINSALLPLEVAYLASYARRLLVLRNFALYINYLHSLLPKNVPKLQRRIPRKEKLSRKII
jgi:hypothetical protein